jgi:hypothetical protein
MSFFEKWNLDRKNDIEYLIAFLRREPQTEEVFLNGEETDILLAVRLLNSIQSETFFKAMEYIKIPDALETAEIPQFSNFKDATERTLQILETAPEGLSFLQLGYQLVSAKEKGANRKYGENHARLAETMSLVEITDSRPHITTNSALGSLVLKLSDEERRELYRRLLMRIRIIQKLICSSVNGGIAYFDLVFFLSEATAIRRRSSTKNILFYVCKNTTVEKYLSNIDWRENNGTERS